MKGILTRAWQKRSGSLLLPSADGDDKVRVVGHVGCYLNRHKDGKVISRDYLDLGNNIIVNDGREDLCRMMSGDTTNRFVTTAKWSDGGHDTMAPATPLAVAVTDSDLTGADLEIVPATVLGTGNENFDVTVATDDALLIDVDNAGATAVTLTPGTARTALQVAADINAVFTTTMLATVEASSIRLTATGTTAPSEIDIQAGNANTLLGFTVATTTGTDSKAVAAAFPSLRVVRFDVTLATTDVYNDPQIISEMGLFTGDDGFYGHKTFGAITKTSDISIDWEWSIDFSLQS
jgi:hypothetical protein